MEKRTNFVQSNSVPGWESQNMYSRQMLAEDVQKKQESASSNQEKQKKKFTKLKKLGKLAVLSSAIYTVGNSVNDTFFEPGTTVDNKIGYKVSLEDSKIQGLDNEKIDEEDLHYTENQPKKITLEKDAVIRSNDWTYEGATDSYYQNNPNSPTHTEIAKTKERLSFKIDEGEIIQGKNGRVGVRIENLEKTADNRYTGIKPEVDSDGWVFVDVNPKDFE